MFRWSFVAGWGFCFLLLLVGFFPSCVVGNAHPCSADPDCSQGLVCVRGWCTPSWFRERLNAADGGTEAKGGNDRTSTETASNENRDASAQPESGQETRDGQSPDNTPPSDTSSDIRPDQAAPTEPSEPSGEQPPEGPSEPNCPGACEAGTTRPCYPGGAKGCDANGTNCTAPCKGGQQFCVRQAGQCPDWSKCYGATIPEAEQCDGIDNDCNGTIDTGCVITVAGSGQAGFKDGQGKAAQFNQPTALTVDANGNVFVVDKGNYAIRKIDPSGNVTTFAGTGKQGTNNGPGTQATFDVPNDIIVVSSGDLVVTDRSNFRFINTLGFVRSEIILKGDSSITLNRIASDRARNNSFYYTFTHNVVQRISSQFSIQISSGQEGYKDGQSGSADFRNPSGLANDTLGNLYVADTGNHRIRVLNTGNGKISTFAGSGQKSFQNGQGLAASFNSPQDIILDTSGNLYVVDSGNHAIRKLTPSQDVTTVAGSGLAGMKDGVPKQAQFKDPQDIALDKNGNLYVADTQNHLIRKIVLK